MILKLEEQHVTALARLHKENLPSFLSAYPITCIERFYRLQLKRNHQVLLGYFENENLLGFVFGTDDVEKLYDDFIAENRFYFYLMTFRTLFLNPKFILLFLGKYFAASPESACKRQLVYIAVDKNSAAQGIGRQLLLALETEWKNFSYYELEVEAKNKAYDFYLRNGFFPVHESDHWIEKKFLLGKKLE